MLGAGLAHHFGLPLAASWHTNVHEYPARRSEWLAAHAARAGAQSGGQTIEDLSYWLPRRVLHHGAGAFCAQHDLCAQLERATGRPCLLMPRGVDAELFNPRKRKRAGRRTRTRAGLCGAAFCGEKRCRCLPCAGRAGSDGTHELPLSDCGTRRRGSVAAPAIAVAPTSRACSEVKRFQRLTRIWTCSCFPRTQTRSATWCLKHWPVESQRLLRRMADRRQWCETARPGALCRTKSSRELWREFWAIRRDMPPCEQLRAPTH